MRTTKFVGAAGAGLVLLAGGVGAARADHGHVPGQQITVEGSASATSVQRGPAASELLWRCQAVTTGGLVASTGISCELRQNGSTLDTVGTAAEGNAVSSVPRLATVANGSYEICWTARAFTLHAEFVYDVTTPNCATFTA